ncbi:MAG: hypothetical protein K5873_04405 [Treponema sp.]|nr:hypothetical protein [Treponema sp.]
MTTKYRIEDDNFHNYKKGNTFEEIFVELAKNEGYLPYKIIEENTNKDVTKKFRKYIEDTGFVFCETIENEMNQKLLEKIEYYSDFYNVFSYNDKKGVFTSLKCSQYETDFQELLDRGYVEIGHHERYSIFYERNNENSPIYKFNKQGAIPEEDYDTLIANSTILSESIESFAENVQVLDEDWKEEEEEKPFVITEEDRIDFDVKMATEYKGRLYSILYFKYRGVEFTYAPIVLAERINKEQDFESEILDEVTYFITPKQMDEMYELLRETPSWIKFIEFCYDEGICNNFINYDFMKTEIEFKEKKYPIAMIEVDYDFFRYAYTTKEAKDNKEFIKYLKNEWDCWDVCDVSKKNLEKIQDFLDDGKLYQEFEQFCNENNIPNIIPKQNLKDDDDYKGFEFDTREYKKAQERKKLPEGYSEEDEETLEISEEEYTRLSQARHWIFINNNLRWKNSPKKDILDLFYENTYLTGFCGFTCADINKNKEFLQTNNALIYEQYRNLIKVKNIFKDTLNCSNSIYTDILNIKDITMPFANEISKKKFFEYYEKCMEDAFPTQDDQKEDFTLRGKYKIEGNEKSIFDRIAFSSLENVFDSIYVMDVKPPFKVIDLETKEDVTEKVMEIAAEQNHIFIDSEEIIRKLPKCFEKLNKKLISLDFKDVDEKSVKCLNPISLKNIIGFKDLWQNNCVPFGYKRNFVLFVDLNQSDNPIYRIDYRKTSDFESRKLLNESAEDYLGKLKL